MKIVELCHRIARRAQGGDFASLCLAGQMDVLQSANAAMAKLYNRLPFYFKQMTVGFQLPAQRTISVAVTNGSAVIASAPFSTAEIGRTVILDGDPGWNMVVDTNQLLNPYNGPTGTVSGIVYGDAVYSSRYPFDRVSGNPRFTDPTQFGIMNQAVTRGISPLYGLTPTFGRPRYWWAQNFGNSQGNSPLLFLKFFPFPDTTYTIDVELNFWSKRVTLDDLNANVTIPVPDQFLDACLIPLGIRELMTLPSFESKGDEKLLLANAADAEAFLLAQPGQVAAPANRVQTPFGY